MKWIQVAGLWLSAALVSHMAFADEPFVQQLSSQTNISGTKLDVVMYQNVGKSTYIYLLDSSKKEVTGLVVELPDHPKRGDVYFANNKQAQKNGGKEAATVALINGDKLTPLDRGSISFDQVPKFDSNSFAKSRQNLTTAGHDQQIANFALKFNQKSSNQDAVKISANVKVKAVSGRSMSLSIGEEKSLGPKLAAVDFFSESHGRVRSEFGVYNSHRVHGERLAMREWVQFSLNHIPSSGQEYKVYDSSADLKDLGDGVATFIETGKAAFISVLKNGFADPYERDLGDVEAPETRRSKRTKADVSKDFFELQTNNKRWSALWQQEEVYRQLGVKEDAKPENDEVTVSGQVKMVVAPKSAGDLIVFDFNLTAAHKHNGFTTPIKGRIVDIWQGQAKTGDNESVKFDFAKISKDLSRIHTFSYIFDAVKANPNLEIDYVALDDLDAEINVEAPSGLGPIGRDNWDRVTGENVEARLVVLGARLFQRQSSKDLAASNGQIISQLTDYPVPYDVYDKFVKSYNKEFSGTKGFKKISDTDALQWYTTAIGKQVYNENAYQLKRDISKIRASLDFED